MIGWTQVGGRGRREGKKRIWFENDMYVRIMKETNNPNLIKYTN